MIFPDFYFGDLGNDIRQLIDGDHTILAEIQWLLEIRLHEPIKPFHAIVYVTERTGLLSIAPNINSARTRQFRDCNLAAQSCRRLLPSAIPRPVRSENIMKSNNSRL